MTADPSPAAGSALRTRGAWCAGLAGGALLLVALSAGVVATDADAAVWKHRSAIALGGALLCGLAFALASARGKRRTVAVALSAALSMIAIEAVLRVFAGPYYAAVYRLNETWLFEHIPGARKINSIPTPYGVERIAFEIDGDGFRGPELLAPGSSKRVLVYGDLFIAARATRLEDTFVERLAAELRTGLSTGVEAVNAGVVGYGPDQICLRMEAELPRLRPDLVVVSVLAENDYGDLVRDRLFELGPANEVRRHRAVLSQTMRDAYAQAQSKFMIPKTFGVLEARLRAAIFSSGTPAPGAADDCEIELAMCREEHQAAVVERDDVAMCDRPDHPDADVRLEPASESARYKIALMAGVLEAIRDAAKRSGVPLLVMVVPSASDVCEGYDMDAVDRTRFPNWRPENLTAPIERIADAYGIAHVDLYAAFKATNANELYFHGGDTHWNSAGQALAAKLTARRIAERGLLK